MKWSTRKIGQIICPFITLHFRDTVCMIDTTEQFVYNDLLFIDFTID